MLSQPSYVSDPSIPIYLGCTRWLNFPPRVVSLTLASPNFLNRASLQTPGHFRSLPHSTNMFFGALPRILWHTPMPTPNLLPRLTQIQGTARGQWRWRGVHPYSYRAVTVQLTLWEKGKRAKGGRESESLTSCPFLCNMALMFGHGLFSVERLCKASPCLKIPVLGLFDGNCDSAWRLLWSYEQVMRGWTRERWEKDGKGMREEWEEGERGMRDRWVGGGSGGWDREGVCGWRYDVVGQHVTDL